MTDTGGFAVAVNRMALSGKIPEGDNRWGKFNAAFENCRIEPMDLANQIYTGHAYTSWHSPSYRTSDNWQCSQFIAVDMDTEDARSSVSMLSNHDFVMTYGTLIHTTPSHTIEKPRARVIFLLDRPIINPKAYNVACKFVSSILGGDKVATDPSRFFYGNADAEIDYIGNCIDVNLLNTFHKRHLLKHGKEQDIAHHQREQAPQRHHYSGEEDKTQTISNALEKIDPWKLDYMDWVSVVAAIKYELGEGAYDLAERWANGKKGEVQKMWRSFRRDGGNLSTIATIVHFAKQGA